MDGPQPHPSNPTAAHCDGKQAFDSHQLAQRVASRRRGHSGHFHPYRCASCGKWHLGGNVVPKAIRERRSRRPR